jgi:phosphatidylglycerophosphatase A
VDEIAGMWVSLLFLPFTAFTAAAAFLLFRVMDVIKPFPAGRLERLPGGLGIVADDLMAGIYANLAVRLLLVTWPA